MFNMSETNLITTLPEPQADVAEVNKRVPHKFKYICRSKCKQFALEFAKANRAHKFTRVSEEFLLSCEIAIRNHIQSRIKSHPSSGKTLM